MLPTQYNVIWSTPSADAAGSMPLGNGAVGINLWVERGGDVCFYLSRTDSWGEFGQLYKVGRVRVRLCEAGGAPLLKGEGFRWELKLEEGAVLVLTERGQVRIWVDAHHPVVHVLADAGQPLTGRISYELWRTEDRELLDNRERHGLHMGAPYPVFHYRDEVAALGEGQVGWYHRNARSTWADSLRQQGLERLLATQADPLLHRAFGALIQGHGLRKVSEHALESVAAAKRFTASIVTDCRQCEEPGDWVAGIRALAEAVPHADDPSAWQNHVAWWRAFWERSWIDADGSEAARKVSRGYTLQRFVNACAGRGDFPIKFNGSIFTVDWHYDGESFDADYRRWGPGYWHQNTRLHYWSMLYAGDFEMMRPYFALYRKALPVATERIRRHCGHAGATFTETMYFWGAYLEHNYGWTASGAAEQSAHLRRDTDLPGHLCQNLYIRLHNSSGLEVLYHGLLFYRYTGDAAFLEETLLPIAEAVIDYYDLHYPRKGGKLFISPAQVIEQWWSAVNPMPEIAGLHACLQQLLDLPDTYCKRRADWQRLYDALPELPTGEVEGKTVYHPAATWEGPPRNTENPELYAVFPYQRCGLGSADLEVGRETFRRRANTHDQGWAQDGMQAALLGLKNAARESVIKRLTTPSAYARFPAFWGPGFDWIPDQDQGGSAAHAFQLMAMQCRGNTIYLLPAWPDSWSIDFKLAGPEGIHVRGQRTTDGKLAYQIEGKSAPSFTVIEPD